MEGILLNCDILCAGGEGCMPFSMVFDGIVNLFKEHVFITIALAVVLLYLLFQKPKTFLLVVFLVLLFIGILYLTTMLSSGNRTIWK
jgi:hypothetical protein